MTIKPIAVAKTKIMDASEGLAKFPEFSPREDMQNNKHIYTQSIITALMNYLGSSDTTYVGSEVPLGWTASVRQGVLIPDLMVALNCDVERINGQDGYELQSQPHPPEFALEVASVSTAQRDYTEKRAGYANYGVLEYWRFDPTDGRRYPAGLAGDRLAGGVYEPVELEYYGDGNKRGYSEALGLYVCWEDGELRLYDPMTESYLRTHEEDAARAEAEAAARRMEAARADYADARADNADARADNADARADVEAARAAAAEERAADADARAEAEAARAEEEAEARRRADAVIRELQEQLARERGDG